MRAARPRPLRAVAAAALAGGGLAINAARPAAAALPLCNGTAIAIAQNATTDFGDVVVPIRKGASVASNCQTGSGSAGPWVTALQRHLRNCNGQNIDVDGIYGPDTKQAVKNVQSAGHITADGIYGPKTMTVMRWYTVADSGKTSCRSYSTLAL